MTPRTRSRVALAGLLVPLLLAAGCGGDDAPPAAQVPGLTQRLDAVDEAVAAHDDAATRTAVDRLEHTVHDARQSGDLDQTRADEILSAAETLLQALPGAETTPSSTKTPSPSSEPTQTPPPTHTPPPPPEHEKKDKPPKPDKHDEHGPDHKH